MKQAKISWQNGQPQSDEFGDVYFSTAGGIAETEYVFLQQNKLPELWQGKADFVIAETGFGTGLNFLTTVKHWLNNTNTPSKLHFISTEKYPLSKQDLQQVLSIWPEFDELRDELIAAYPPATSGFHQRWLFDNRVSLQLLQGDAVDMLSQLKARVDVWYLDGFSPDKNPQMWSDEIFKQMARLSHQGSRFSTYTAAGFVRRGLQAAGFEVEKVTGFGKKREMLSGHMNQDLCVPRSAPWFYLPKNKIAIKKAAVIGAGIAGVTTAWALAKQGWQVELIDQHKTIAGAASGNPLAVILPRLGLDNSVDTEFYFQAYLKTVFELNSLAQQYKDLDWQQTGVLQLPSSERIKKQIKQINKISDLAELVSADQSSQISGLDIKHDCLFYPEAGFISPESLCRLLMQSVNNVHCHLGREVSKLNRVNNKWQLLDKNHQKIVEADAVVLANAASVGQFEQTSWMGVQSVKGQLSYLSSNATSRLIKMPVCYEGYVLPEHNGQHIVGATFSPNDCSSDIKIKDHSKNLVDINHWIEDLFSIDAEKINGRASIRAVSNDRMPIVGPVADECFYRKNYYDLSKGKPEYKYTNAEYLPNLYMNVAHGSRGFTSAFLCAELLATQLGNQPLPVSEKIYHGLHPSRFMIRDFKKNKLGQE